MMWPAVLGMTYALLPDSKAGLAGGLILGVAGLGNAVGPLLGGFLTDELSWEWVFFLNLPITAFAVFVTWREVPETTSTVPSATSTTSGSRSCRPASSPILLALDEGPDDRVRRPGDPRAVRARRGVARRVPVRGAPPGRRRARAERRAAQPRVRGVVRGGAPHVGDCSSRPCSTCRSSWRRSSGTRPLGSGRGAAAAHGRVRGHVVHRRVALRPAWAAPRRGRRRRVPRASACCCCRSSTTTPATASLVPGMIVMGLGVGLFYSAITTIAVTALDPSQSSLAGGIVYMCQIARRRGRTRPQHRDRRRRRRPSPTASRSRSGSTPCSRSSVCSSCSLFVGREQPAPGHVEDSPAGAPPPPPRPRVTCAGRRSSLRFW